MLSIQGSWKNLIKTIFLRFAGDEINLKDFLYTFTAMNELEWV